MTCEFAALRISGKWLITSVTKLPVLSPTKQNGRIGKVVASHAAVARSVPAEVALIYAMHEAFRRYCP